MDFEQAWLLWALPIAFALGWIGSRWDVRQWKREQRDSPKSPMRGLALLLDERHDQAIDAFIETVQQDAETADLQFALGNLFRKRGEYERAVRLHQHLLQRADLGKADRSRAQHALADDYMKAGLFDRAEQAYGALAGTEHHADAQLALLALHERARDWRAAAGVAAALEAGGAGSFASRIAHHHCELAIEADAAGRADDADREVEAARARAPGDARPLVLAGARAATRGDDAAAVAAWNRLLELHPGAFNLVAGRYAASAVAAGVADDARARLAALYDRAPSQDVLEARVALETDADRRAALLDAHLASHPTLAAARALLVQRPSGAGAPPPESVLPAVERAAKPLRRYRCAACAFEAEHYFWQCPGCLGWGTYPPRRLEDNA